MDLIEVVKSRKSIRGFKPQPVPEEVLAEILDIARWTPSAVNDQAWEFVVLSSRKPLGTLTTWRSSW